MTAQAPYESPVSDAMVERAAKALQHVNDCSLLLWDELPDYGKDRLRDQARAALTAALAAREGGRDAVQAEVVGKVYRMEDGTCEVDWLLEGGIHAVGSDGDAYLYTMDIPEPEDGAIEVRLAAAAAERGEP